MNLIIRAEASPQIGMGHVMRCFALAQAWHDQGGGLVFAMAGTVPVFEERLRSEKMGIFKLASDPGSMKDAEETIALAEQNRASWIVVDGYDFGADYQRLLKSAGLKLLFIDDYGHAVHYPADMVLNQNISARPGLYEHRAPDTRLLLGTRYVLLRREFLNWRKRQRLVPERATKVMVTLGGSDPDNVTEKIIHALSKVPVKELEVVVIAGESNPHYGVLKEAVASSGGQIRLRRGVNDMAAVMAWADVAVSAGGSTCWELAFMGVPNLVIILAENQAPIAEGLAAGGICINLGRHEKLTPDHLGAMLTRLLLSGEMREEMALRNHELVDGEGTARVLMHLRDKKLRLRRADKDDGKLIWEWANDPAVRASAFSKDPIPWEEHVTWFSRKLLEPSCFIYIALDDQDRPVGQIRFDLTGSDEAEVDVSIEKEKRGLGYGGLLIDMAVEELFRASTVNAVQAFVKSENHRSIEAFEKARFKRMGSQNVQGYETVRCLRVRNR